MRLGRLGPNAKAGAKPAENAKHRPAPAAAANREELEQPDTEMESYLAALAPNSDTEVTDPTGRRFGNAQAYQVRLSEDSDARLRQLADERQITPLVLLQDWVQQRLDWELRGRRR